MADPAPNKDAVAFAKGFSGTAAAAIAGACALVVGVTASYEGLRTKPYYDPAHIQTVCYGETERDMRTYTPVECLALLQNREAADYAPAVLKCVPGFADERHRYAFAASIDAAYNAGIAAFCKSRMARSFNAGAWPRGCDLFAGWYATARVNGKPTPLAGLQRRRLSERALCLKGETEAVPASFRTVAVDKHVDESRLYAVCETTLRPHVEEHIV